MFSGVVSGTGQITGLTQRQQTMTLTIQPAQTTFLAGIHRGDSVAVNGTCLTVEQVTATALRVTLMPQTVKKTNFHLCQMGSVVNLERSLTVGGRVEGHFVTGHVDEMVAVLAKRTNENAVELALELPARLEKQVVPQGSVALNGVSLTVMEVTSELYRGIDSPHSNQDEPSRLTTW